MGGGTFATLEDNGERAEYINLAGPPAMTTDDWIDGKIDRGIGWRDGHSRLHESPEGRRMLWGDRDDGRGL